MSRDAVRRGVDRNRPFQTRDKRQMLAAASLLATLSSTQQAAHDAELRRLGHVELTYDDLEGEWYEVPPEPRPPLTIQALEDLVEQARAWGATRGEMPASSRALLVGVALVGALLTGQAPGTTSCAFMTTRQVLAHLAGCSEKTVYRSSRDPRLQATGLQIKGHAQITRCGRSAGQARFDGSLAQFYVSDHAHQVNTALAWQQAARWRLDFGEHIDSHLGAAGALSGAMGALTLRALLFDRAPLWLGVQAALAALFALDPEAYFDWTAELECLFDLADLKEAEQNEKRGVVGTDVLMFASLTGQVNGSASPPPWIEHPASWMGAHDPGGRDPVPDSAHRVTL
ncbi:hypothetical protein [Deinococcus hopiensis]|uniref:hypothetical protein n=1 Tax=Deinococcus hopiensis TaxID=309885 RepID=UPI000A00F82B|nr:hypothetical protein [Deinococcus hopiensis]